MLSDRARQALEDMRENVLLAREFTAGFTIETFRADRRTVYAVTRCLEIISEAARRLPDDVLGRHPQQPWRAIMDAGNVYRHEYDDVAEEIVWRTVQNSLPQLLAVIEVELKGTV